MPDNAGQPSKLLKFDPDTNFQVEEDLAVCLDQARAINDDLVNLNRAGQDLLSDIGGVGLSKAASAQLENFIQTLDGFLGTLHTYNHRMVRYSLTTGYTLANQRRQAPAFNKRNSVNPDGRQ